MLARPRKTLTVTLGVALAVAAIVASASTAYATMRGGQAVSASCPSCGQTFTASLKSGTDMVFNGAIDSIPITVSCTSFSGSATTPASPAKKINLPSPPTISGCTDSSGGTDNITTNQSHGSWMLELSGKSGHYKITLVVPKEGAAFTSSVLSSCTVTAAPKKPAKISGSYDGTSTDTVSNAQIATKGTGCTSSTATANATVVFSPPPGPPPI
jgi:hypothetical protein